MLRPIVFFVFSVKIIRKFLTRQQLFRSQLNNHAVLKEFAVLLDSEEVKH